MPELTPLEQRFLTALDAEPHSPEQRHAVSRIKESVVQLASFIESFVPAGRHKSLALTALEDVQLRSNRGIFDA